MIVVVDSGVWISALEFGGTPAAALERVFQTDELAVCSEIEEEIQRVMHEKFGHNLEFIRLRVTPLLQQALRVDVTGTIKGACRDPNDDFVLECAVKAGAGVIVAGDKDLLALGTYRTIRILSCREYLDSHRRPLQV